MNLFVDVDSFLADSNILPKIHPLIDKVVKENVEALEEVKDDDLMVFLNRKHAIIRQAMS